MLQRDNDHLSDGMIDPIVNQPVIEYFHRQLLVRAFDQEIGRRGWIGCQPGEIIVQLPLCAGRQPQETIGS
jgi:hypothetical protein